MRPSAQRHRFVVPPEDAGLRLDQVLARHVPGLSRRKARTLLDFGGVFLDKRRVKVAGRVVKPGQEVVAVLGPAFERISLRTPLPTFRVVHLDVDIAIVEKPAGLLTAPTPESDRNNLARMLTEQLGARVFVVHRLDRGTSGLLVFARTEGANRTLAEVFRTHDVERTYLAMLSGKVPWNEQTVNLPIQGKAAATHFSVLETMDSAATLVRCSLLTGRTHQIRLHARHLGHPVLGDPQYGTATPLDPPRMALHASVLGIRHPRTGETLRFESPWPQDLTTWTEHLRSARK